MYSNTLLVSRFRILFNISVMALNKIAQVVNAYYGVIVKYVITLVKIISSHRHRSKFFRTLGTQCMHSFKGLISDFT